MAPFIEREQMGERFIWGRGEKVHLGHAHFEADLLGNQTWYGAQKKNVWVKSCESMHSTKDKE